jgi:hypothetical protein
VQNGERFLVRVDRGGGDRRSPYLVAEEILAHHPAILRATGRAIGGLFQEVEGTGRFNRKRFRITVTKGTTARGNEVSPGREGEDAAATAIGVKKVIRRLREQEAEKLDGVDRKIAELEAKVDAARRRRVEIVREAWSRGNVVRVAEMHERVALRDAEVAKRSAA